jgi:HSP20 family protein
MMGKGLLATSDDLERGQAEMDRLYQEMIAPGRWVVVRHTHVWRPPTDVVETDEDVIVRVEVAGMKESDFNISLSERLLAITGVRYDPRAKVAYHQMEIRYGEFRTEIYLHWQVEQDKITANYADGFLHVTLPKVAVRRVHVVDVNHADTQ